MQECITELKPLFLEKTAICFVCDDKFVPYFSVALESLYRNSDKNKEYDIIVLESDISKDNKCNFESYNTNKFSIRFFDISKYLDTTDTGLFHSIDRYTIHTYYRFFVTDVFKNYEKVIYLDSDILIKSDIADLYNIDIEDNYLAATKDLFIPLYLNINNSKFNDYFYNTLHLKNPNNYFQAGVLIFNIPYCVENYIKTKLMETLEEIKEPLIVDQDILNKVCENKVKYIDGKWDYDVHIDILCRNNYGLFDATYNNEDQELYYEIKDDPYIVHFAGANKPWNNIKLIYAKEYWKYIFLSKYRTFFLKNYLYNIVYKKLKIILMIVKESY